MSKHLKEKQKCPHHVRSSLSNCRDSPLREKCSKATNSWDPGVCSFPQWQIEFALLAPNRSFPQWQIEIHQSFFSSLLEGEALSRSICVLGRGGEHIKNMENFFGFPKKILIISTFVGNYL